MGVKMMRWRPWPPPISKQFRVKLTVDRMKGSDWEYDGVVEKDNGGLVVEIKWKGPKISLGSFRRTVRRNYTREEIPKRVEGSNDAVLVEWAEEFNSVCTFSGFKDNVFHPWDISFSVLHMPNQGAKNKISVFGTAQVNLADYASKAEDHVTQVNIPLTVLSTPVEQCPKLYISLSFLEILTAQDPSEATVTQSPIVPLPSPSPSGETEKDEVSALKARLKKVKIFTDYVSIRRAKKACREDGSEERQSPKSEEGEYSYSFDSDSLGESEGEADEGKGGTAVRNSFSYGTLAVANFTGVLSYAGIGTNNDDEAWVYYSNRRRSDVGYSHVEESGSAVPVQSLLPSSKLSILPWRKRKLSLSPKAKGEPLLKKAYAEEGGDDIDFARRQLSPDESVLSAWNTTDEGLNVPVSEFGDDSFTVGSWEQKDITSRDGLMTIHTEVFFASIDQRNEKAAGESACTALVAVIADWLQNNPNLMPIKSQFDGLIREGSLEWRNLCENDTYKERFPDKHFDLETVLQSQIRDLSVIPDKSFVGFFRPDEMEEGNFKFLDGAMSFDSIWDEIASSVSSSNAEASVFIISWNDHFFILKVEVDTYYIIDTLGERLHEGCNQAYILKFDRNTSICKLPSNSEASEEKSDAATTVKQQNSPTQPISSGPNSQEGTSEIVSVEPMKNNDEGVLVCQGKESCKEYIKSFLAAIPIRELQNDIKKGLQTSTLLHHRLQIEFHFTQLQPPMLSASPAPETADNAMLEVASCSA